MNESAHNFESVMREYCDEVLKMFVGERLINKVFGRMMQSHALGRMMIEHYDALAGEGARPTLSGLQKQIGYARTLATFFALLRITGLVATERDPNDKRVKYLLPTDRAKIGLRMWFIPKLKSCERLGMLNPGFSEALTSDDALFAHYVRQSRYILDNVNRQFPQFPLINRFHSFDCGDRIAFFLLRSHYNEVLAQPQDATDQVRWFKFSSAQLADKLGVSKSHVRNVVNDAETLGALEHDEPRHRIALNQAFVTEARAWLINTLALFAEAARRSVVHVDS